MGSLIAEIQSLGPLQNDPEVGKYRVSWTAEESVEAWNSESQTKVWFQSQALRADTIRRIQSIQLFSYSHNQGWATFPNLGVWTWFELAIFGSSPSPKGAWLSHKNLETTGENRWETGALFDPRTDLFRQLDDGDKIAVRICARFARWNLTAGEGHLVIEIGEDRSSQEIFQHTKLAPSADNKDPFRVVTLRKGNGNEKISCQIIHTRLGNVAVTPYISISHCWGHLKGDRPKSEITINGKPFKVTKNVWHILRRLRKPDDDTNLWIDALCINQSDKDEMTQQVGIMGKIYKNSIRGILWLGEARDDDEKASASLAIELLNDLGRPGADLGTYFAMTEERAEVRSGYTEKFKAFARMLSLRWWRRIWVIQETVLPPEVEFLYTSSGQFPFESLKGMRDLLKRTNESSRVLRNLLRGEGYDPLLEFERIVVPMISTREEWQDATKRDSLALPILRRRFASSEAGWRQDLFYGLLGMVRSSGPQLTPNYKIPVGLAIWKAVHYCLLVEDNPLFLQGTRLRPFKDENDMDPSFQWPADFHVQATPF